MIGEFGRRLVETAPATGLARRGPQRI